LPFHAIEPASVPGRAVLARTGKIMWTKWTNPSGRQAWRRTLHVRLDIPGNSRPAFWVS